MSNYGDVGEAAILTSLMLSPTTLLWKNSGRSAMDLQDPRVPMYFSLYLTCFTQERNVTPCDHSHDIH